MCRCIQYLNTDQLAMVQQIIKEVDEEQFAIYWQPIWRQADIWHEVCKRIADRVSELKRPE